MPFMTENKPLSANIQLIASRANNPEDREFAKVLLNIFEAAHQRGFPRTLEEAGISDEFEVQKKPHSVIDFNPSTRIVRNKLNDLSALVAPKGAVLLGALLDNIGVPVKNETLEDVAGWGHYEGGSVSPLKATLNGVKKILRNQIQAITPEYPDGFIIGIRQSGIVITDPGNPEHYQRFKHHIESYHALRQKNEK